LRAIGERGIAALSKPISLQYLDQAEAILDEIRELLTIPEYFSEADHTVQAAT